MTEECSVRPKPSQGLTSTHQCVSENPLKEKIRGQTKTETPAVSPNPTFCRVSSSSRTSWSWRVRTQSGAGNTSAETLEVSALRWPLQRVSVRSQTCAKKNRGGMGPGGGWRRKRRRTRTGLQQLFGGGGGGGVMLTSTGGAWPKKSSLEFHQPIRMHHGRRSPAGIEVFLSEDKSVR